MLANTTKTLFNLVKEINLKSIQEDADLPVRIAVLGEAGLARDLANALGVKPWVGTLSDLDEQRPGDILVRISKDEVPDEPLPKGGLEVVLSDQTPSLPDRVTLASLEAQELEKLAPELLEKTPDNLRLSLARHVPPLRSAYARLLIEQTSRSNALYAASTGVAQIVPVLSLPLNVADIVVLSKNQLIMAYKLALAEGKKGNPTELMREVVSVVGGGFMFRQIARELVGLVPVWGIVPKVAVSYAGTWVIGQTVHVWAAEGETTTVKELRRYYDQALEQGREVAGTLVERVRSEGGRRPFRRRARGAKQLSQNKPLPPAQDEPTEE